MPLGNDFLMEERNPAIPAETYDWGEQVVINPLALDQDCHDLFL